MGAGRLEDTGHWAGRPSRLPSSVKSGCSKGWGLCEERCHFYTGILCTFTWDGDLSERAFEGFFIRSTFPCMGWASEWDPGPH